MRSVLVTLSVALLACATSARADLAGAVERLVADEIQEFLPADGIGGAAVAVRIGGRTLHSRP